MIRRQWNALRVGHHVLVHDDADPHMALVPGRVTSVRSDSGVNDIAIRISPVTGPSRVVHPRRLAVHLEQLEADRRCRRCDTYANAERAGSN